MEEKKKRKRVRRHSTTILDFGKKLKLLCKKANIEEFHFREDMNNNYGIKFARTEEILADDYIYNLNKPTLEKILRYWRHEHHIEFTVAMIYMPLEKFSKKLDKSETFSNEFFGSYQIIRPLQNTEDSYALEAFEILNEKGGILNYMYSYNFSKNDEIYKGEVRTATRYYFSLMSRPHENETKNSAFRCVSFYVGDQLKGNKFDFLSGLMLRGVAGDRDKDTDYSVAIPFFAIPLGKEWPLKEANPTSFFLDDTTRKLRRMHKNGLIIAGEITRQISPEIFSFCEKIFKNTVFREVLFKNNPLVLHSVPQRHIESIGVSAIAWKACLERAV